MCADGISTGAFGASGFSREPVDPAVICKEKQQRENRQLSARWKRKYAIYSSESVSSYPKPSTLGVSTL